MVVGEPWFSMGTCLWLRQRLVDGLVGPLLLVAVHVAVALVGARVVCLPRIAPVSGEAGGGAPHRSTGATGDVPEKEVVDRAH